MSQLVLHEIGIAPSFGHLLQQITAKQNCQHTAKLGHNGRTK